jgi:hypothetical protein
MVVECQLGELKAVAGRHNAGESSEPNLPNGDLKFREYGRIAGLTLRCASWDTGILMCS